MVSEKEKGLQDVKMLCKKECRISFEKTMYLMKKVLKALQRRAEQIILKWLYLGIW